MFRSALTRRRKFVVGFLLAPVVVIATMTAGLASASACSPVITATGDCNAHVTFTASASDGTDDERTNNLIDVQYSTTGDDNSFLSIRGANRLTADGDKYQFSKSNDFSFSDSFVVPTQTTEASKVYVRVVALARWGEKADLGDRNVTESTVVDLPGDCAKPTASIKPASCDSPMAQVFLNNAGHEPVTFGLYKDAAETPFATYELSNQSRTVNVNVDNGFLLSIHARGMANVEQQLAVPSGCNQPAATTTTTTAPTPPPPPPPAHDVVQPAAAQVCAADGSGWTLTFDNSKSTVPQTFLVKDDQGNTVDSVVVAAASTDIKTYPFVNVKGTRLVVSANGQTLQTTDAKTDCVKSSASIEAACNTAAGSGILLGFTNTGKVSETFSVFQDDKQVDGSPFTLAPSNEITWKLLKLDDGQTAHVKVVGNSGFVAEKTVTLTCGAAAGGTGTSVLGESLVNPALAATGLDLPQLIAFGAVLTAIGAAMLRTSFNLAIATVSVGSRPRVLKLSSLTMTSLQQRFNNLLGRNGKHLRRRNEKRSAFSR